MTGRGRGSTGSPRCETVPRAAKMECGGNKRVPPTSVQGPSPNTSALVWQGPHRHLKGTTGEKINLAASLSPRGQLQMQRRQGGCLGGRLGPGFPYSLIVLLDGCPNRAVKNGGEGKKSHMLRLISLCSTPPPPARLSHHLLYGLNTH